MEKRFSYGDSSQGIMRILVHFCILRIPVFNYNYVNPALRMLSLHTLTALKLYEENFTVSRL